MNAPTPRTLSGLHAAYVSATGLALRLDMARERDWFEWTKRGFTEADLIQVIGHLKRGIRERRRNQGALKFSNLIGQPDFFEEDLAEAKAHARSAGFSLSPKSSVLRSAGRPPAPPTREPRSAGQIMEADRAFEQFRALKGKL